LETKKSRPFGDPPELDRGFLAGPNFSSFPAENCSALPHKEFL
jgi:hypothetical protein